MGAELILVVDDEEPMRVLLSTFLVGQGYRVESARDGLEALERLRDDPPDLLTDVGMPRLNGLELARRLRAHHSTARLPILMLSGRAEADQILTGYAQGADDYVPKPFELAVIGAKVAALLRRSAPVGEALRRQGKVVLILHGQGGAGATTVAVNVAVALAADARYRVALLDLDLEFGSAAMMLDVRPDRALANVGAVSLADFDEATFASFGVEHASGVWVMVGCTAPEQAELVTVPAVQQLLDRLRSQADYVVVDTAASFSEITLAALDAADAVCLITTPRLAALKATADCLAVLAKLDGQLDRQLLILNRTTPTGLTDAQVAQFFGRKPTVVIPYTPLFGDAADAGRPLIITQPANEGASKLRDLAAMIAALVPAPI
jgi:pilus assembly protein CpaE